VSGPACRDELKIVHALVKPQYFIPVHGEQRHLKAHSGLAREMGMDPRNIIISDVGKVIEIGPKGAKINGTVPAGKVFVDGYGVGDVGNIVLRDRLHLSQDGLIVVVATIDEYSKQLLSGPDIVSRGFVYVRESETLMDEVRAVAQAAMLDALRAAGNYLDRAALKKRVKDDVSRFLYGKTKRKPMILPVIMDV
jgi:ribonuclease J